MHDSTPIEATAVAGAVLLSLSPDLAREFAAVWSAAHAGDTLLADTRPDWHADVVGLIAAAARADFQAGTGPAPVYARRLAPVPLEATS